MLGYAIANPTYRAFWYENGQKEHEARYLDGRMNGLAIYWDENGKLKAEAIFKNGKQMN